MRKTILAAMLLCFSALVLMGAGPLDLAFRSPVGGTLPALAKWDTVVVVYSTEARADSLAGDGTNYLYKLATSGLVGNDVVRVRRLNDWVEGRNSRSWRDDDGDTARVYRLGTGYDVPEFAYANLSNMGTLQADTLGYTSFGNNTMLWTDSSFLSAGIRFINLKFPQETPAGTGKRRASIVYLPFDEIPDNSTIVYAAISVSVSGNTALAYTDTIIAQPMHEAWDKWMLTKDYSNFDNMAHAAWTSQESTGPAGAWGGTTRYPWVPDLDYTKKLWDISTISDWSGSDSTAIADKDQFDINITNTVQAFVNGTPNTGIMINLADYAGSESSFSMYGWDPGSHSTIPGRAPYVVVKYITKRYQKPFGTSDWALVYQTDDLGAIANKAYADTLQARGGKFTMFGFKQYGSLPGLGVVGVNDQTRRLSLAELFNLYYRGNEVGSHSKFHSPSKGYHDRIVASGLGVASVPYDSMVVDFSPNWMYAVADSARALGIINEDMRDSPTFAKSFGAPVSFLEAYAQKILVDHGYSAWRTLGQIGTYDRDKYYTLPNTGYRASADSASMYVAHAARHVRNIREMFPMGMHQLIVGPPDSNSTSLTHLPKVTNNMKRLVFQRRGDNIGVVNFFNHDLKSGGSGFYPTEGVNADELGRICYVTNLLNGRFMTMAELGKWFAASSTPIDHPFNAARPDTFRMYEADGVWAKPDGVDNRFIRGVK